jgi:hypothetical protein
MKGRNYAMLSLMFSITIFYIILSIQTAFAANLNVTKNAKTEIKVGDILEVNVTITNLENTEISVSVKEHITNADPVQPESFYSGNCPYKMCIEPNYYEWNVTIPASSIYTITYKIKPLSFGSFTIPPTEVQTSSGENFYSSSLDILVHCIPNGKCEPNKGENYYTCPQDCPSGSADGVCDLIKDGRCDPDCSPGADPDCVNSSSNISESICGNNVCDSNETQENCCKDCGCPKDMSCIDNKCISNTCGNGVCDNGENYTICPQDCPLKSSNRTWTYVIIGIVIAVLLFFIFSRMRIGSEGEGT